MEKLSVFKFSLDSAKPEKIKEIIESYIKSRGMAYDDKMKCYRTGGDEKETHRKNLAKSIGVSLASAALGGTFAHSYISVAFGFEYQINGKELIIKAYQIYKGKRRFIHSTFNNTPAGTSYYTDLRNSLFKALAENGTELAGKEVEKV